MSILAPILAPVNFTFSDMLAENETADVYLPTLEFAFLPTVEEEAEAVELLNNDEPTDAEWDARAERSLSLDAVCASHPWL